MLLNCGVGENSWESLGLQGVPTSHPKGNQSWIFIGRTDVEAETPILWPPDMKSWLIWKNPDAGKDWGQEEKGKIEDEMASLTQWTWVCVDSGSWWWRGRPGILQSTGSQRVGHNKVTELNWTESLSHIGLFCDPMNRSPPGSSVHGISQARILHLVAISFSKRSSWPRDWTHGSCIGRQILYCRATKEALKGHERGLLWFTGVVDVIIYNSLP